MFVITGSIALSWALAAPPSASTDVEAERLRRLQVQGLHVRSDTLRQQLAGRCSEPGLLATVSSEDAALALRAAALFEETAALVNELLATEPMANERDMLNLSLARAYADAARMLLKAHACVPVRAHLDGAGRLLRRAFITAGSHPENLAEVEEVQKALDERRREFPPPPMWHAPAPAPCPVCGPPAEPRVELPPWPERLVLRFEAGVAAGRRDQNPAQETEQGGDEAPSYVGVTLGVSLLGRVTMGPRWALLFGPSYTFWRAQSKLERERFARSHHIAARLEVAVGLGRRWRDAVSLHPGVEVGVQPVFHGITGEEVVPDALKGPSFVGSVGICFMAASMCVSGRVGRAVGTADDYPTLGVTFGVDIFGAVRAYRFRRGRR